LLPQCKVEGGFDTSSSYYYIDKFLNKRREDMKNRNMKKEATNVKMMPAISRADMLSEEEEREHSVNSAAA